MLTLVPAFYLPSICGHGIYGLLGQSIGYCGPLVCQAYVRDAFGGYQFAERGMVSHPCAHDLRSLSSRFRFANVDFAILWSLQCWMPLYSHVFSYDINCQYSLKFVQRMKSLVQWFQDFGSKAMKMFSDALRIIKCIGKFHLPRHCGKCRYKFSFNFLPGVAITDGEAPERIWSSLNALGQRTREMSAGHRHNVINEYYSDMNWKRTQGLGMSHCVMRVSLSATDCFSISCGIESEVH